MEHGQPSHHSPPAYQPHSPDRQRSGSYSYNTGPPPAASPRPSTTSSYYDPTSEARISQQRDREASINSSNTNPYQPRSPVTRRDVYEHQLPPPPPQHQLQPSYANGHPAPGPPGLPPHPPPPASVEVPYHYSPPRPVHGQTLPHPHSPPGMHDPVRSNGSSHSHSLSRESLPAPPPPPPPRPSTPPTARKSNPMAMTNLLSDTAPPAPAPVPAPAPTPAQAEPLPVAAPPPPPPAAAPPPAPPAPTAAKLPPASSANGAKSSSRRTSRENGSGRTKIKQEPQHEQSRQHQHQAPPPPPPPAQAQAPPARPPLPPPTGPPTLTIRDTERAYREIEAADLSDVETPIPGIAGPQAEWTQRAYKRTLELEITENMKRKRRRVETMRRYRDLFENAAHADRQAYVDIHETEVSEEVRAREIEEDKERKKDQQRKRRREKAIADEEVKRAEALQTLATVEDEDEKARLEKEIRRYDRKIQDTQNRLQGLPTARERAAKQESPAHTAALGRREREVAMDGGLMTSFYTNGNEDDTPEAAAANAAAAAPAAGTAGDTPATATTGTTGAATKSGGRGGRGGRGGAAAGAAGGGTGGGGGGRARKSKEKKQAEKENAARAQALVDQGQELPTIAPKEEERLQSLAEKQRLAREREDSDVASDAEDEINGDVSLLKDGAGNGKQQLTAGLTGMAKFESKGYNQIYEQISRDLAKGIPKVSRVKNNSLDTKQSNARKTAQLASKEARRWQARTNKSSKDVQARAKRAMREMLGFWKRNERDEREGRKAAERQELDKARRAEAEREANRQRRKLNFLISQTELYSHFIGKKVKTDEIERHGNDSASGVAPTAQTIVDRPAGKVVDMPDSVAKLGKKVTNFEDLDFDAEDETALQEAAMANAQNAIKEAQDRARAFNNQGDADDEDTDDGRAGKGSKDLAGAQADFDEGEMNFQNPTSLQSMDVAQPKMLSCQLKEYQLKGLNWLVNLYEQGINGILADEMGLGKTVQSISVMAYLAENHDIWGPFLVIAPASTLHNWQQEITRFVPDIKVLPYWGSAKDRKILRKFWDRKHITYNRDSPFHVLVTSYQLVVQDTAYFQKVKWQYMILDEAQAIKSSQSSRWKSLLGFHCRNRLLLTGTPIQNNMQELWALLHFIMPSLFDSHDEFSEWFSKDIENHAQSNTKLNEDQLRRLHMILKPFMLRRIKKHVQKELGDKIEEDVFCDLTYRQRALYSSLRNKISILDLIEKAAVGGSEDSDTTATLMNLVMQFRKVCNHPDLFERAEIVSPLSTSYFAETASFMREGSFVQVAYSVRSLIQFWVPKLLAEDPGRIEVAGPENDRAGWREKVMRTELSIWDERHISTGSAGTAGTGAGAVKGSAGRGGAFDWLRFVDRSPGDVAKVARLSTFDRALVELREQAQSENRLDRLRVVYDDDDEDEAGDAGDDAGHKSKKSSNKGFTPTHALFNIVARNSRRSLASATEHGHLAKLLNISRDTISDAGYSVIETCFFPAASAPPVDLVTRSQRALDRNENALFNIPIRRALSPISPATEAALLSTRLPVEKFPQTNLLPTPAKQRQRFTQIQVPSMRRFVTDSGKLAKLDQLLRQLKEGGHRVLLYFQMTRMIDLMEEYLTYRNYKYCRLDGSTKLEDRRDTVAAFQSSPEIFVFLLSTRAGGLGINLTSADTVIFYDSDWNPTIDSQAMDRAHRLGQTRQVTVYRLITRATIEERIRKRALQKEEVQRVVISGQPASSGSGVDFNTRNAGAGGSAGGSGGYGGALNGAIAPRDTGSGNRTKEMALWLADDEQAAQLERREMEVMEEEARLAAASAGGVPGKRKRKNAAAAGAAAGGGKRKEVSMDDMYHEGEGKFEDGPNSLDVSGAATPISNLGGDGAGMAGSKKRKGGTGATGTLSKKAKTVKQRLAVVDGQVG